MDYLLFIYHTYLSRKEGILLILINYKETNNGFSTQRLSCTIHRRLQMLAAVKNSILRGEYLPKSRAKIVGCVPYPLALLLGCKFQQAKRLSLLDPLNNKFFRSCITNLTTIHIYIYMLLDMSQIIGISIFLFVFIFI